MYQEILETFREDTLPNLDAVVLAVLEYFETNPIQAKIPAQDANVIVLGSEGAYTTGMLLFRGANAVFGNESTYPDVFATHSDRDTVVVVSASGEKHAPGMVRYAQEEGCEVFLLTTNKKSRAADLLDSKHVVVFPKVREPYTYNVSTYMGMLLARTGEKPGAIKRNLEEILPALPETFASFNAFCFIIPPQYEALKGLLLAKCDELFGPRITARAYTTEQIHHAKTVVPSPTECFISFGERNKEYGDVDTRVHIPLRESGDIADLMAISYATIGTIQKQLPPYFKDNIERYVQEASRRFDSDIKIIVE